MKKQVKLDEEFQKIINDIITNKEFLRRKEFLHHGDISVYEHSLKVSYKAYKMAKFWHTDYESAAIAGLLHDFYEKPWQEDKTKHKFFEQHGFTHAKNSLVNTQKHFKEYLTPQIENAILRHMFPLNIIPPKYAIGWIVTLSDKIVSLEVFRYPSKLLMLIGISKRKK